MFNWLGNLPIWFQVIFSLLFLAVVVFVIISSYRKGTSIAFGKLSINTSSPGIKKVNVHAKCQHVKDVVVLINEVNKILSEKIEIKYFHILRKQMAFVEEKAAILEGVLLKNFIKLLAARDVVSPIESDAFREYKLVIAAVRFDMIGKVRIIFRENTYAEMTEAEFNDYTNRKVELVVVNVSGLLNELYFIRNSVTRAEVFKSNMEIIPEIKAHLREAFLYARRITIDAEAKIHQLDIKLEELMAPWLGE